jgi:tRNA-splicing ligase RtcB
MKKIELEAFEKTMKEHNVLAKVEESTKDESPFAYKNIFDVMKYQDENVEILHYLKPIINIKG